jgi:hypothetical protein
LQRVSGADWMKRSVVSSDVFQRRIGNKAILFDDIPGYAPGYRILANILTVPRINLTLGLRSGSRAIDLVQFRRRYMGEMPRRIRVLRLSPPVVGSAKPPAARVRKRRRRMCMSRMCMTDPEAT